MGLNPLVAPVVILHQTERTVLFGMAKFIQMKNNFNANIVHMQLNLKLA